MLNITISIITVKIDVIYEHIIYIGFCCFRAHLNDLENIPIFIVICTVYLLTNPSLSLAANLIRIFTLARIAHTLVYAVVVVPQPARTVSFGIGYFITIYMALMSSMHFITSM